MHLAAIEALIKANISHCRVEMAADGNRLDLLLVSAEFAALNRVQRQQKVYRLLDDRIKSGEIHAISMKLMTPEEAPDR